VDLVAIVFELLMVCLLVLQMIIGLLVAMDLDS